MFVLTDIVAFDPHNSAMKSELLLHLRKLQLREGQYSIQAYMTEYMGRQSLLYSETFHPPVMVSPSPQDCRARVSILPKATWPMGCIYVFATWTFPSNQSLLLKFCTPLNTFSAKKIYSINSNKFCLHFSLADPLSRECYKSDCH